MEQKDPKDMTASELLRWLADDDDQSNCRMCHLFYSSGECGGNRCSDWKRDLADKIDAEIVKAYSEKLDTCAMRWAKANGWPDFKQGEDFGGWLERCAIPRPRFEDGEPVQFGDDTDELDGVEKFIFLRNGGCCQMQDADGNICNVFHGKRVKRRAPEVLGADGLPLDEDDTVYGMGREQHRYTVQVPYSINEEVGKRFCVQCYDHDEGNITWCDPSMLTHERPVLGADGKPIVVGETVYPTYGFYAGTSGKVVSVEHQDNVRVELCCSTERFDGCYLTHTPPETQERIDDDATMPPAEYCAAYGIDLGDDPDRETATRAMIADLLRRQREYDKRTGGAE